MYLKALEIQGFKSFPDKTILTFDEDITAIVGPNGSGKSNLSDAIRWVMGEQSSKALRGGKMEDVIFGGTAKRGQTNFAEVSLVLDNTDGRLAREEDEVIVTRRYYRSGDSEYYINRRSVRLRDVHELFMDTGLGREGYSIIGQGRIDEILSVRSTDRREVFEAAAGISRFRHRKEEAERKLERTEENLVRINDKLAELELQVEPLKKQSETAEKYLGLREELKGLEISVWMEQLERLKEQAAELDANYQKAVEQRDEAKASQEAAYTAAEQYSSQMREKDLEAERLRQDMREQQTRLSELESVLAVLQSDQQHNERSIQRLLGELEQQEGREVSLNNQIQQRRTRLAEIERQVEEIRTQLRCKQDENRRMEQNAGMLARELEELRKQESLETADTAETKALLSALAAAQQEMEHRERDLDTQTQELEQRLTQARQETQNTKKAAQKAEEEWNAAGNVIQGYTLRMESRRKKAEQARQEQARLQMEENTLQSRIKMLREMEKLHEGYSKAVKLVMHEAQSGTLKNIHGAVAELIQAPDRYTVAIETALGSAMQNLVVEREEDGKAVLQYLKRWDAGRATILPLSSIRPSELREKEQLKEEAGFVGVGDQLISFHPKYRNVCANLLGRVVIMEDLDSGIAVARKYGYRFRIVTLDGQVLNPGGSMTGGSASRSAGILSRANELERLQRQADKQSQESAQVRQTLSAAERELTAASYELETAQGQLRHWEDERLRLQTQLTHCQSAEEELERQLDMANRELEQLRLRTRQTQQDTQAARNRMEQLAGTAAARKSEAEGKSRGQTELQERVQRITQEVSELNARIAALEAEREVTRIGLSELERLKESISGDRTQNHTQISEYQQTNAILAQEIASKEERQLQLREEEQKLAQQLAALNQEKLELEGQRIKASRESQNRYEALSRAEGEVSRMEQRRMSAALEEKQLLDKLWDTYELNYETAQPQRNELESVSKATKRISELKRNISALGQVNLGAIEEFRRVNERYTYLDHQRGDVNRAKKELETILDGITTEMKHIFVREFHAIGEAFSQTFMELFGGGKATLELDDPEDVLGCGIEIRVQPPGKTLKTITLLSGGEKAFVAIALYFAIIRVRPTPFVVMDEIEAALDDNNVVRFSKYMRNMSNKTQFIVITHRRGTMEEADVLYGVTMQEQGVSRMLTLNLNDVEKTLNMETF